VTEDRQSVASSRFLPREGAAKHRLDAQHKFEETPQVLQAWILSGPLFVGQILSEASGRKKIAISSKA